MECPAVDGDGSGSGDDECVRRRAGRGSAPMGPALLAEHGVRRNGLARPLRPGDGPERQVVGPAGHGVLLHARGRRRQGADRHEQRPAARPAAPGRPRRAAVPATRPTAAWPGSWSCPSWTGDIYLDWPQAGHVLAGHRRRRPGLHGDQSRRGGVPGPARDWPTATTARSATRAATWRPRTSRRWRPAPPTPTSSGCWTCGSAAGVRPHDSAHSSILLDGPYLYVNTSNGLTSKHDGVDKPEAPSLVVVDKATGRLVAQEREGISRRIFHSTWSSPALGEVGGRRLVFFGGGDGVVYAFEALPAGTRPAEGDAASRRPGRAAGRDAPLRLAVRLRSHGAQGEHPPLHPQPPGEPQQHQEHARVPRRPAST